MGGPPVVVLDVNGTLSDTGVLADRFAEVGAAPLLGPLWFASVLRDGIAITAAGGCADLAALAADLLPPLLDGQPLTRPVDEAVRLLTDALATLPAHEDVGPGLRALHGAGVRLVALTNGTVANADRLLDEAGARDVVEVVLSAQDLGAWKPAPSAYLAAAAAVDRSPAGLMMVAAHPWDLQGAAAAGLRIAWLRRQDRSYPSAVPPPEVVADDLAELVRFVADD